MQIITNNQYRPLLYFSDLTESDQITVKSDFDYLDDLESDVFIRYKGNIYHLGEFMKIDFPVADPMHGWQGHCEESYFSGKLVKVSACGDAVIMGSYFS